MYKISDLCFPFHFCCKKRTIFFYFLLIFGINQSLAQLSCGQDIDLNTWSQQGILSSGQWTVAPGGNSVSQDVNGLSTWFLSQNDFFNVLIEGSIQVNTSNDDDLVGFVFGYQDPIGVITNPGSTYFKTYIFDWKQATQNYYGLNCIEGYALYEVDGNFNFNNIVGVPGSYVYPELWSRINSTNVNLIGTNYGNNGWNDFQQYDFRLKYTADSIVIWIDDVVIFQQGGCFEPGKFGFYNQSQDNVIYSNFSYQSEYDFTIEDTIICQNDAANFFIGSGCQNYLPSSTLFVWNFGDGETENGINPSHVYLNPGNYQVELTTTDSLGCVNSTVHDIVVLELPTSNNAGLDDTTCFLSYTLNAIGGDGSWTGPSGVIFSNPNDSNTTVTVPSSGSFVFIWSSANTEGCEFDGQVTITFKEITVSAVIVEPLCYGGNNGEITVFALDGESPVSFQWDAAANNQTTAHISNLSVGNYSVLITDALGCSKDTTFSLNEPNPFSFTTNIVNTDCEGSNGEIEIIGITGGSPPYFYDWGSGLVTTNSIDNLSEGQYSIQISDALGCDSIINATVATDVIDVNDETICFGEMVTLNATGASDYTWSPPNGLSATIGANVQASPTETTTYTITSTNGCVAYATVTVNNLSPIEVNEGVVCPNGFIELNASGAIDYLWSPSIGLSGTTGASVIASPSETTTYTITSLVNGCLTTTTSTVVVLAPLVFSGSVQPNPLDFSNLIGHCSATPAIYDYTWIFPDGTQGNATTLDHTFQSEPATQLVSLIAEDENGCKDSKIIVIFIENPLIYYVPNTFTPNGDEKNNIFQPVFFSGFDSYSFHMTIYNRWGEIIFESFDVSKGWDGTFRNKLVPDGVYTWTISFKKYNNDSKTILNGHVNVLK
jgi:gliding motility-associated-like protein